MPHPRHIETDARSLPGTNVTMTPRRPAWSAAAACTRARVRDKSSSGGGNHAQCHHAYTPFQTCCALFRRPPQASLGSNDPSELSERSGVTSQNSSKNWITRPSDLLVDSTFFSKGPKLLSLRRALSQSESQLGPTSGLMSLHRLESPVLCFRSPEQLSLERYCTAMICLRHAADEKVAGV